MFSKLTIAALAGMLMATSVSAEAVEVKMLNKGAWGATVFEPAFIKAAIGERLAPA